jgi:pimeloyl-ACP methyl ester carboxylesterase
MKRAPAARNAPTVAPRVRRSYFESRFGQLHVHVAMPAGGGFDEATALLCVHSGVRSARMFRGFLELMARDRSAYAPDVPGFGGSDGPREPASIEDLAAGLGDFLDSMRFRQIDLLGHQLGAALIAELAASRPQQVRRAVLVGVPLLTELERQTAQPALPVPDGAHPQNGALFAQAAVALRHYAMRERLGAVTQPVLVLRPRDELWEATQRAREVLPRARIVDLPDHGTALFESAPQVVVDTVREFLRG